MLTFYEVRRKSFSVKNNLETVSFGDHIHSDIEILYMRAGSQNITVDGKKYTVNKGETAVVFPNIRHSYIKEKADKADAILIICSSKMYKSFFPDLSEFIPENPVIAAKDMPNDAKYAFGAIDKSQNRDVRLAWIVIILSQIIDKLTLTHKNPFPIEDMSYKIISYIDENFTQHISLQSVAEALSISKSYVSRIFSEKIKIDFRQYVNVLRAEYAAKLIRATGDSLTVISENAGFNSQSTFNRIFRSIYGMTPREFRNNIDKYSK